MSTELDVLTLAKSLSVHISASEHELNDEMAEKFSLGAWYTKACECLASRFSEFSTATLTHSYLLGVIASRSGDKALGRAFYSGYQNAIRDLFQFDTNATHRYSFCVTEKTGNGPKHIQASLKKMSEKITVDGTKTFVTASDIATDLVLVLSSGWVDGLNQLAVVHCPLNKETESVVLTQLPSLPFLPEIAHGSVSFNEHLINESSVLSEDGYAQYVRPFRWYEDLHVFAANFGMMVGVALDVNNVSMLKKLNLLVSSLLRLPTGDPAPYNYRLFDGLTDLLNVFMPELESMMSEHSETLGRMWLRDLKVFSVAKSARAKRAETAWQMNAV